LDYLQGAEYCNTNSRRLETSARIILKDEDGTDSFALFLFYLAYEEIAKAIFCIFAHKEWVTPEFVDPIFKRHEFKIFLFEEIFRSFMIIHGVGYLGGKRLGEIPLREFELQYESLISEHRNKTLDFLYVGKQGNTWKYPQVVISNLDEELKLIKKKIEGLASTYYLLTEQIKDEVTVDNLKFIENDDGTFTMRYDSV